MKNNIKNLSILIIFMLFLLTETTNASFNWVIPNSIGYFAWENITNVNFTANYFNHNIQTSFIAIPQNNLNLTNSLILGYNFTAGTTIPLNYSLFNGYILIPNTNNWNFATIYFNGNSSTAKIPYKSNQINDLSYGIPTQMVIYGTNSTFLNKFTYSENVNSTNQINMTYNFNLNVPYLLIITSPTTYSFSFIPYQFGSISDKVIVNPSNAIITNYGTFKSQSLKQIITNESIIIAPNYFVGNGFGSYANGSIYNTSNTLTHLSQIAYRNTEYSLTSEYSMFPEILIPAYSTNAVVSTINGNTIPPTPTSTSAVDSGNGWHHYFAYRESINITNWNYTFTSFYNNGYHNLTFKNLKYAVITIPYYFEMGNWSSGWQIGIEGYNPINHLDLGAIPFAILGNTTSTITLILLNKTNESYTYNFAYIEWGNKYAGTGLQVVNTGYNNQSIKKIYMPFNFSAGSTLKTFYISNYVNTTTNSSIFVNFTNPLNSQSCIYIWSGPLTYQYAYGVGFAYYYIRDWQVIPLLDGVTYYNPYWATDKTFYVVDNARSSPTYIQSAHGLAEGPETYGGPEYAYIANATQEYQETINYNETTYAYINITYNSGYLYRPATHSFTLNSTIQYYQSSASSSSPPIKHTPQPIGSPFSINITNATLNTSNVATIIKNNGLNQNITLIGLKTTSLILLFLDVLFILMIFAFGSHEGIAIFGLIGLWLMGILPMSITNLILASLITLLYIASKIPSWLNGDK